MLCYMPISSHASLSLYPSLLPSVSLPSLVVLSRFHRRFAGPFPPRSSRATWPGGGAGAPPTPPPKVPYPNPTLPNAQHIPCSPLGPDPRPYPARIPPSLYPPPARIRPLSHAALVPPPLPCPDARKRITSYRSPAKHNHPNNSSGRGTTPQRNGSNSSSSTTGRDQGQGQGRSQAGPGPGPGMLAGWTPLSPARNAWGALFGTTNAATATATATAAAPPGGGSAGGSKGHGDVFGDVTKAVKVGMLEPRQAVVFYCTWYAPRHLPSALRPHFYHCAAHDSPRRNAPTPLTLQFLHPLLCISLINGLPGTLYITQTLAAFAYGLMGRDVYPLRTLESALLLLRGREPRYGRRHCQSRHFFEAPSVCVVCFHPCLYPLTYAPHAHTHMHIPAVMIYRPKPPPPRGLRAAPCS